MEEEKPESLIPPYVLYDPAFVPQSFGFNNIGAICWGNSLIQFMLSIPCLNKTVLENESSLSANLFAMEYIKLVKSCVASSTTQSVYQNDSQLATASASILAALVARAHKKGMRINMGMGQECADEAFCLFIEMLDCAKVDSLFNSVYELSIKCTNKDCGKVVSSIRDKSYRIAMFDDTHITTQERFIRYLRIHPSQVDFYKCEDCGNKMVKTYRSEKLKMIREVVVIIFNKYYVKDHKWFPQTMSFNSHHNTTLKYELIAKIEHSGTTSGGHYWAETKRLCGSNSAENNDQKWYRMNDSHVSTASSQPTPNTFMIAYHLVSADVCMD